MSAREMQRYRDYGPDGLQEAGVIDAGLYTGPWLTPEEREALATGESEYTVEEWDACVLHDAPKAASSRFRYLARPRCPACGLRAGRRYERSIRCMACGASSRVEP